MRLSRHQCTKKCIKVRKRGTTIYSTGASVLRGENLPFGEFGVLILGLLGDFLLLWAILATLGIVWMFYKMPGMVYGIIDQLLSERGFPRTRGRKAGKPAEGIGGQIIGAITDKFLNTPQTQTPPAGQPQPAAPDYYGP